MWTGKYGPAQDRLVIKQYEEDTNLRCSLLIDSSASMRYGKKNSTKFDYACTLAACLALLVLRQQDAVGSVMFDNRIRSRVPLRTSQKHLQDILVSLEESQPKEKTELSQVFKDIVQTFPKRGVMVLISDLLGAEESIVRGIATLRKAGHDVIVLHVLDDDEVDFPFSDPTRFEGLEVDDHLTCNPRAFTRRLFGGFEIASLSEFVALVQHQRVTTSSRGRATLPMPYFPKSCTNVWLRFVVKTQNRMRPRAV
jgi:uncharacterized protein (DUF58 family)